jgi:pimeloyl-ACP methyl ester carboxylesterase
VSHLIAEARFLDRLAAAGHRCQPIHLTGEGDAHALALLPRITGDRPAVLIAHGGGNDRLYGLWYLVERLLGQGYAILTAHLPGHGPAGRDHFGTAAARRRLDAMVVAAANLPGVSGPPYVIGQSMGGALSLDLALRRSAVRGVALVSAPVALNLDLRLLREFPALLRRPFRRAYGYAGIWGALPAGGPFKRGDFPIRLAQAGSYVSAFAALLAELDLLARCQAGGPGVPCLILHGRQDGIVPVANAWQLKDVIGEAAELLVLDRICHLDPLLDEGGVSAILAWLHRTSMAKPLDL